MYKLQMKKLREFGEYDACDALECNNYEGQRKLRPHRVNELVSEIESGHFLTGDIAFAILAYDGNRKIMVNGQHQCNAVIKTGSSISVVYQEYICATPQELADLYARFDKTPPRSLGDILTPEAAALGVEWKRAVIRLVVSAASLIARGEAISFHEGKLEKVAYLSQHLKQGAFVDFIIKDGVSSFHLQRAPVVQAMMLTWDKDKIHARTFWEDVRDGVGLSQGNPALVLRNYLMSTGLTKSRTVKTDIATTREMYVKCIHAWNAARKGTATALKYHIDAPLPKISA